MKRTWKLSAVLVVAGALLLGALSILTLSLLDMEQERAQAEVEMSIQQELRLAMWQLDSVGMRLLLGGAESVTRESFSFQSGESWQRQSSVSSGKKSEELDEKNDVTIQLEQALIANDSPSDWVAKNRPKREDAKVAYDNALETKNKSRYNGVNFKAAPQKKAVLKDTGLVEKMARSLAVESQAETINSFAVGNARRSNGDAFSDILEGVVDDVVVDTFLPVWVDDELYVVKRGGYGSFEGRLLDVDKLKKVLLGQVVVAVLGTKDLVKSGEGDVNDPLSMVTWPLRLQFQRSNGALELGVTPLRGALILGWCAVIIAILAVLALLRGLWKLSERRAAFVSSVTHELRTPLTTFQLYSDMMAEGMVPEEQKLGYLQTMRSEAGRLGRLVENVLSYAQIERGSARQTMETISVDVLLARVLPHLQERAGQAKGGVKVEVSDYLREKQFVTDVTGVEQVLFNLVDNACKYALPHTEDKVIHLKLSESKKSLLFHVCDSGPGIANGERKKLFGAFRRSAKDAAEAGAPGVGLGLALCRRIARRLGGDVSCLPCDDGTCFELRVKASN